MHQKRWKDPKAECEAIYQHLCCYEYPWECFYGINFAFYRTFSSPTIAKLYYATGHIANSTSKRVGDTDILMHAWVDFGIDSKEGRESWEHLNRIHGVWKKRTSNEDFVYVLCCFVVDTIRFIDVFGWRKLTQIEREAVFYFWEKVGRRMGIENIPHSLAEAETAVENYVESDVTSSETDEGRHLTSAVTNLLCEWYWFVPRRLVRSGATALLYTIGGASFVRKLGLPEPSPVMLLLLGVLAYLRAGLLTFFPMRTAPHRLSEILMQAHYPMVTSLEAGPSRSSSAAKEMDFSRVGPPSVLQAIKQH
jgi:hypothetical protein